MFPMKGWRNNVTNYVMKRLIKALIFTLLVFSSQQNLAQITNMEDCTEPGERELLQDQLLTRAEIIALMDKDFEAKVSQQDKCAGALSGAAGNGSGAGGANSAGSSGGGTGSNNVNSANLTSAPNQLAQGAQSTSLNNDLSTTSSVPNSGSASSSPAATGSNGRREQELLDADANRQQIEQLKLVAEMEENPSIKENLLQRIKDLEREAN